MFSDRVIQKIERATFFETQCRSNNLILVLALFHLAPQQRLFTHTRVISSGVDGKVVGTDADAMQLVDDERQQRFLRLLHKLHGDQ